jgi:imidazolonepropionase-like amidohydrolase
MRSVRLPALAPLAALPALAALAALAAFLGLAAPAAAQAPDPAAALRDLPPAGTVAFVDVSVVPMDRERVLERQTVVVRDGRVAAIGPARSTPVPAGASRVDGRGKFLAPGLVDMHAHVAQGTESLADPAGRQLALSLAAGVTTLRGLVAAPTALALRDRVARGEVLGPTLYVAAPSLNGNSVTSPADGVRLVERAKRDGYDVLKIHGGVSAETYDSIAVAARRAGLRLVGHVTPEYGLARALAAGQQVEHLDGYIAASLRDGVDAPPGQFVLDPAVLAQVDSARLRAVIAETVRRGVWNGPTLALFATLASDETAEQLATRPELRYTPPQALAQWAAQRSPLTQAPAEGRHAYVALRNLLVRELHRAGGRLLVGSDSPQIYMTPGFGALREIEAFVAAGLSPYAALEAATRNPAEFLGRADAGTVATGKRADLILLDGNPLADVANLRRLSGVMVGGRWLDAARLAALREGVYAALPK